MEGCTEWHAREEPDMKQIYPRPHSSFVIDEPLEITTMNSSISYTNTNPSKVWVEAYGCSANIADSEMIKGLLSQKGFRIAANEEEGDVNVMVTCSVKDPTEHRMLYRIKELTKSNKPIVVGGCLPKADRTKVEAISPNASLLGPNSLDKTVETVRSAMTNMKTVFLDDSSSSKLNIPRVRVNPVISIIEISTGCMSECTFCQTKLARGWLKSYRMGEIKRQIYNDVLEGCKEIWLSSTDNGCYGRDIGCDLVDLLNYCIDIYGDFKIRVGMMNPMFIPSMKDRLLDTFQRNDKIFKFLHIPVQSGNEKILREMKRGHTVDTFRQAVKTFRNKMPNITIATDIIVGFPSETNEQFQDTIMLISETQPDIVNISKYSYRPGTLAAKHSRTNSQIIKKRCEEIHLFVKEISKKRNEYWKDWVGEVIIDEIKDGFLVGRNLAYKPVTISYKTSGMSEDVSRRLLGSKISVQIEHTSTNSLHGRMVENNC